MMIVKYERYVNDYNRSYETLYVRSLNELADWLFENARDYKRDLFFINPDEDWFYHNGKLHLDSSCINVRTHPGRYCVQEIIDNGKIIYSCGEYTNGICHWNEDVKQWLRDCIKRQENPQFNFG